MVAIVVQIKALVSKTNDGSIEIAWKLQVLFAFLWECSSILDNKTSQCQMFIPTWQVITFSNHFILVPCTLVERMSLEICANYDKGKLWHGERTCSYRTKKEEDKGMSGKLITWN